VGLKPSRSESYFFAVCLSVQYDPRRWDCPAPLGITYMEGDVNAMLHVYQKTSSRNIMYCTSCVPVLNSNFEGTEALSVAQQGPSGCCCSTCPLFHGADSEVK